MIEKKLKKSSRALKRQYHLQSANSAQEKINVTYGRQLLDALNKQFECPEKKSDFALADAMEELLKDNWDLVRGNSLCYTAQPKADITLLLCDIAQWIVDTKYTQYDIDLKEVTQRDDVRHPNIARKLRLSDTKPTLIKQGNSYFVYGNTDGSFWNITQLDTKDMERFHIDFTQTELNLRQLADMCKYISSKQGHTLKSAIEVLMPTVTVLTDHNDYFPLNRPDLDVKKILETHILGRDGEHLIPVGVLTNLDLNPVQEPIKSPYISTARLSEPQAFFVEADELTRLGQHSDLTRKLVGAKSEREKMLTHDISAPETEFYVRLKKLHKDLYDYSVHGTGQELNAAEPVYAEIFKFKMFYDEFETREPNVIAKLSPALSREIQFIFKLVSVRSTSDNATERCIAVRHNRLKEAMTGQCILSPSEVLEQLEARKRVFEQTKALLGQALIPKRRAAWEFLYNRIARFTPGSIIQQEPEPYVAYTDGIDALPITSQLVKDLGVINIISVINASKTQLTLDELKQILEPLTPTLRTIFIQGMTDILLLIVKSISDFSYVEAFSSSEDDKKIVFEATIKPYIDITGHSASVKSVRDYKVIVKYLTTEEQQSFLIDLKLRLPNVWTEIVHAAFIDGAKDSVLNNMKSAIKKRWLAYQEEIITQDVSFINNPMSVLLRGHLFSEEEKRQIVRERVANLNFERIYAAKNISLFRDQIDEFSPGLVMNTLFKQHPWIHKDPESEIVQTFLVDRLSAQLIAGLKPNPSKWKWLQTGVDLKCKHFQWQPIAPVELETESKGYPLSNLQDLYLKHSLPNYPSFNKQGAGSVQWRDWRLTRLDVYRILAHRYSCDVASTRIDGIHCTKIEPIGLNELQHISVNQLNYIETLLINVATEDVPVWIVLHRAGEQWIAFCPDGGVMGDALDTIREALPSCCVGNMDFSVNLELNDLHRLESITRWHTLLFGRILPGCRQQDKHFSTFRDTTPLPLMLQQVLSDSVQTPVPILQNITNLFNLRGSLINLFDKHSLIDSSLHDTTQNTRILEQLDQGKFVLEAQETGEFTLRVRDVMSHQQLLDVITLLYHYPVSHLVFTSNCSTELREIFDYNNQLQTITSVSTTLTTRPIYEHATCCAARNRFLKMLAPQHLHEAQDKPAIRHQLWSIAGREMVSWFRRQSTPTIHPDITQMGIEGLDGMFRCLQQDFVASWNDVYQEPAPNLVCMLDLSGNSSVQNPLAYLQQLAMHIKNYDRKKTKCAPLFTSLSIQLPKPMTADCNHVLLELIDILNKRRRDYPNETDEIVIYGLDSQDPFGLSTSLIESLSCRAKDDAFFFIARIPEWDAAIYPDDKQNNLKSEYRKVQNKILDNQRTQRAKKLAQYTSSIYAAVDGTLDPEIIISNRLASQAHTWTYDDIWIPSSSKVLNVQQQQEQEQEQEQQEVHQQTEQRTNSIKKEEPLVTIEFYAKKEDTLISRYSSDDRIPNLFKRFSMWVGSDVDAEHVIERMEWSAATKIMAYESKFRLGIPNDKLPAGFYLARSAVTQGLILCFDHHKEIDELQKQAKSDLKLSNPFKIVLEKPLPVSLLRGDFRQLHRFHSMPDEQHALWVGLSDETVELTPKQLSNCLDVLRQWARDSSASDKFIDYFFKAEKNLSPDRLEAERWFSVKNLKSFAQLFNHYDANKSQSTGTQQWLYIAQQLFEVFQPKRLKDDKQEEPDHMAIWKKRILDPSDNWTECLDQEEVDAMALSIVTLSKTRNEKNIWWGLVDAHGQATGRMRYRDIWYAYQNVLKYVEEHDLIFNEGSMFRYLQDASDFNAQVFLYRLLSVLKRTEGEINSREAGQAVLDHLEYIDWHHNGYFYASSYQQYTYWDTQLQLTGMSPTVKNSPLDYATLWRVDEKVTNPVTHALRFATQRSRVKYAAFMKLKLILNACLKAAPLDLVTMRIFSGCLAIGVDKADQFSPEIMPTLMSQVSQISPSILNWLNKQYDLDGVLQSGTIQLRWNDMVTFAQALDRIPELKERVFALPPDEAMDFLNACGRALQSFYNATKAEHFDILLRLLHENNAHHVFINYPWIIGHYNEYSDPIASAQHLSTYNKTTEKQLVIFQQQLQSIDFKTSKYLPDQSVLSSAMSQIVESKNPAETRRDLVAKWVSEGCDIQLQDTRFRLLHQDEIEKALDYLDLSLNLTHRSKNRSLCQRFLTEYLALETEGGYTIQLQNFVEILKQLDNKSHYNELGQILGLLISHAQKAPRKYYSVPQLQSWLASFVNKKEGCQRHFPLSLCDELLTSSQVSTLLNSNLNALREGADAPELVDKVHGIASLSLPIESLVMLTKFTLQPDPDFEFIQESQDVLKTANPVSQARITQLLTYVALTTPKIRTQVIQQLARQHTFFSQSDDWFLASWDVSQATLIDWFTDNKLSAELLVSLFDSPNIKAAYITTILVHSLGKDAIGDGELLKTVRSKLGTWDQAELGQLAEYCSKQPCPSLADLTLLLNDPSVAMKDLRTWIPYSSKEDDFKLKPLGSVDNSSSEARRPATRSRDPEILLDTQAYCTEIDRTGSRGQAAGRRDLNCQHALIYNNKKSSDLIHHFESVMQARGKDGRSKRHYSLTPQDCDGLLRVIGGMKKKGQSLLTDYEQAELINMLYYANAYSQMSNLSELGSTRLVDTLYAELAEKKSAKTPEEQKYASARVLACMREILLRKTGMWVNHTQMLDLLYASIHNDESMLHQIRTGQGKSIITMMRTASRALDGSIVDVCSAKESLSSRDHAAFATVYQEMRIRHAYITADSDAHEYHDSVVNGIGSVNYFTLGNFSLFLSKHAWEGKTKINLDPTNRVAFLDEADDILIDEKTLFNFSDSSDSVGAYNFDEWVYQATYEFYLQNKDRVSLEALCEFIQSRAVSSPKESTFLAQYIIPALDNDPKAVERRNNILKKLLDASKQASQLKEGVEYCVRPAWKSVSFSDIHIRIAKVMNNNQVREGSTYSDYVQQLLHVRLNKEAAENGKKPDFFVDPMSQVVLSQNVKSMLKTLYFIIEGCTGTPGNKYDLRHYNSVYGIDHIIKLITHEESLTKKLPAQYCDVLPDSFEKEADYEAACEVAHIDALAQSILTHRDRPLLITCRDDIAVKRLSKLVCSRLIELDPNFVLTDITTDTNDSGKSESDIIPTAGREGAVTISARMGRGTDIKPKTEAGLMVIRTYPTIPRIAKQESGRQGRNGMAGNCVDIINFGDVLKEDYLYSNNPMTAKRLMDIKEEQLAHFELKLEKFERLERDFPLKDIGDMTKYIITRSVEQLKYEIKQEKKMSQDRKNDLMIALNFEVFRVLNEYILDKTKNTLRLTLQNAWKEKLDEINSLWRDDGTEEIYQAFLVQVKRSWEQLRAVDGNLKADLIDTLPNQKEKIREIETDVSLRQSNDDQAAILAFEQWWIAGLTEAFSDQSPYANDRDGLKAFYAAKLSISSGPNLTQRADFFRTLTSIMNYQAGYAVHLSGFAEVIRLFVNKRLFADPHYSYYQGYLFEFFTQDWMNRLRAQVHTSSDVNKMSLLLNMSMKIVATRPITDEESRRQLFEFMSDFNQLIHDEFWDKLDQSLVGKIETIFATDNNVTKLLTTHTDRTQLRRYLTLISDDTGNTRKPKVLAYLKDQIKDLGRFPEVIPHVFEIGLVGIESSDLVSNLPNASFMLDIKPEYNDMLWYFLSQRTPIIQQDYIELCYILYEVENISAREALIEKLRNVPPYISLQYINKHLKTKKDRIEALQTIQDSSSLLLVFMRQRNFISPEPGFMHPPANRIENVKYYLACFEKMTPERNKDFFTVINNHRFTGFDIDTFNVLVDMYAGSDNVSSRSLENMCELAVAIQTLTDTASSTFLLSKLRAAPLSFATTTGLAYQFVTALLDECNDMPESAVKALWTAWINEQIIGVHQLKKSIGVIKIAMDLNQRQNWTDYFGLFDAKLKTERRAIMQHLEYKFLDLGDDFSKKCHANFNTLSKKPQKSQSLDDSIRHVMQCLQEIGAIAINPNARVETRAAATKQSYTAEIADLQLYQTSRIKRWTTTSKRQTQALSLFNAINTKMYAANDQTTTSDYYLGILEAILAEQHKLLIDDKQSKYILYRSGYMKLYNRSMELFVKVAQDFLAQPIDSNEKAKMYPILKKQLTTHLTLLIARLPDRHPMKEYLVTFSIDVEATKLLHDKPVSLNNLNQFIQANPTSLPRDLRYMMTPITLLSELTFPESTRPPAPKSWW